MVRWKHSEAFKISGRSEIRGSVAVKEMTIEGTAEIKGGFKAEEAEIRGTNNVNIGPGCEIELVEYGNYFQQVKEATVKDSKRII